MLRTLACIACGAGVALSQTIGVTTNAGRTELFGNSFGVPGVNATYDYVIIGGGNAGNTIAARLALANYSVAVLEAGGFYETLNGNRTQVAGYNFQAVPSVFAGGLFTSLVAYDLTSIPQSGYNGREVRYTAGQVFGGGTAANYGGYFRPTVGAFAQWAANVSDDFWLWDNVLPSYQRSCNFTPPDYSKIDPAFNVSYDLSAYSDEGGPLHVSYGGHLGQFNMHLAEGFEALGFDAIPGANSGRQIGYSYTTSTVNPDYGTRDSSETSFLQYAAIHTDNIKLYPSAIAQRIIFDENRQAVGVEITVNNALNHFTYTLNVTREVILSAGVWHSPQVLMLSGIGPAETLESHGIEVLQDLPGVGQNEWDQPYMNTVWEVDYPTLTQVVAENPEAVAAAVEEFEAQQAGPLSGIGASLIGFEKHSAAARANLSESTLQWLDSLPSDWPDSEFLGLEASSFPEDLGPDDYYLSVGCAMLATSSRGNMTISSNSILDGPVISPNWLADAGDAEQAITQLRRIRQLMHASPGTIREYIPGPEIETDEQILQWLRDNMTTIYHATATCKMGVREDPMAVVDSRARVFGVQGLRVVDASAFPFNPPGQPMSSVYMFAEKIAESILSNDA